jgi:hypothetical protein
MNSLLLVVLVSCPPVAAYPDAGPAQGDSSHQGRPRLFGWLRGHHRHAGGSWPPVAPAPAPTVVPPPATAGPAPRLVPRPQPVTTSPEPPLAVPPDGAPRQMPRGPVGTTGAEPPKD